MLTALWQAGRPLFHVLKLNKINGTFLACPKYRFSAPSSMAGWKGLVSWTFSRLKTEPFSLHIPSIRLLYICPQLSGRLASPYFPFV